MAAIIGAVIDKDNEKEYCLEKYENATMGNVEAKCLQYLNINQDE